MKPVEKQTTTMKTRILSTAIALPIALALASCDVKKTETNTVEEKVSAGAEKAAEGVKEMSEAAADATKDAAEDMKDAAKDAADKVKETAEEVKKEVAPE